MDVWVFIAFPVWLFDEDRCVGGDVDRDQTMCPTVFERIAGTRGHAAFGVENHPFEIGSTWGSVMPNIVPRH